jgi:long-chain acyl-CoA synthetase
VLEMLEVAMNRYAEQPAFRCFGQTLTYADTDRLSRQFAAYLQHKLGVKKGDRIAVMMPNLPAFPLAVLGTRRRRPGKRQSALHAAGAQAPTQRRRR